MSDLDDARAELRLLRQKLEEFQGGLRQMIASTEQDLETARNLQKYLHPNRLPDIPGMKCFARYISAQLLSSEGFDIISTKGGKETWLVASWTESFGLSSLMLQALMKIQGQALVSARPNVQPEEIFNDLSLALTEAKRSGGYRLMVARLDNLTLKLSGFSVGCAPLLKRAGKNAWEWVGRESFAADSLEAASSGSPVLAERAFAFSTSVQPGTRLFYLSSAWAEARSLEAFEKALQVDQSPATPEVLDNLNHFLLRAQETLKRESREADLTAIAVEIDPQKLRLA